MDNWQETSWTRQVSFSFVFKLKNRAARVCQSWSADCLLADKSDPYTEYTTVACFYFGDGLKWDCEKCVSSTKRTAAWGRLIWARSCATANTKQLKETPTELATLSEIIYGKRENKSCSVEYQNRGYIAMLMRVFIMNVIKIRVK